MVTNWIFSLGFRLGSYFLFDTPLFVLCGVPGSMSSTSIDELSNSLNWDLKLSKEEHSR